MASLYHNLEGSPHSRMLLCGCKNQEWQGQSPGLMGENNPFGRVSKTTDHGCWIAGSAIAAVNAP